LQPLPSFCTAKNLGFNLSEVSVVGLGSMGMALAKAMLVGRPKLTVWNRTVTKTLPLVEAGAQTALSLAAAVQASPIILVCVDNYSITKQLFGQPDVVRNLPGRTLIQLSTGTPLEAREAEAWFKKQGATYIDGAIMEYPSGIGTPNTKILFAGPQSAYDQCAPTISPLGGGLRYVGTNIGAAAALDLALLSKYIGMALGVIHGALVCRSENVGIDAFATELTDDDAIALAEIIHSNVYSDPGCKMVVWAQSSQRIQTQAQDAHISNEIPDFMASILKRGIALGLGQEDIAAIFNALNRTSRA
jgi:3-hydroxyisobutyrate dehydrogenase-like beta-hydroxyacid dehydrogenase